MATAIVNAIGIGSAILTTVGFLQSNIAGTAPPEGSTVKIKGTKPTMTPFTIQDFANLGHPPLSRPPRTDRRRLKPGKPLPTSQASQRNPPNWQHPTQGGSINKIYAFDERNGYAGQSDGCSIASGGTCEKTVDQSVPGRRGGYISVSANNDATCIAWITVKQDDGTKGGIWTGDIGYGCGQSWYNSVEPAGTLQEKDWYEVDGVIHKEYVPKCTWIDADHTNDIANAALKFDVGAYESENVEDTFGRDAQCSATIYGGDSGPIAGKCGKTNTSHALFDLRMDGWTVQLTTTFSSSCTAQPGKRSPTTATAIHKRSRPTWMADNLIMSNFTSQPAEQLCSSETSWGPDFIGPDGNFCDMEKKELTPLCAVSDVEGCVEVDEDAGHVVKRRTVARRSANVVHKSYGKISKWGGQWLMEGVDGAALLRWCGLGLWESDRTSSPAL
jgi:hypothetical protein